MANDANIPVQPAAPVAQGPVLPVKTFAVTDINGVVVYVQAVCLVDELGRPVTPMSEATGQALLAAVKALHTTLAQNVGDIPPA